MRKYATRTPSLLRNRRVLSLGKGDKKKNAMISSQDYPEKEDEVLKTELFSAERERLKHWERDSPATHDFGRAKIRTDSSAQKH